MKTVQKRHDLERLTAEEVLEYFTYDNILGRLLWKRRQGNSRADNAFNTKYAGKPAGHRRSDGYITLRFGGHRHLQHRVIWLIETGVWPESDLDHENLDRGNDRFSNLREASPTQNKGNKGLQSNNQSGLKGISKLKRKHINLWEARVQVAGERHYLGYYDCPAAAHFAYQVAADMHFKEFARFA